MSEHKKGIMLGGTIAVAGVLGLLFVTVTFSPLSGSNVQGSVGPNPGPSPVTVSSFSCDVKNQSCEIVLYNSGTSDAQAIGCAFHTIYSGNGSSAAAIDTAGILSNQPRGSAMTIAIAGTSSVVVYCTEMGYPSYALQAGSPVGGEVQFANGEMIPAGFAGTWR